MKRKAKALHGTARNSSFLSFPKEAAFAAVVVFFFGTVDGRRLRLCGRVVTHRPASSFSFSFSFSLKKTRAHPSLSALDESQRAGWPASATRAFQHPRPPPPPPVPQQQQQQQQNKAGKKRPKPYTRSCLRPEGQSSSYNSSNNNNNSSNNDASRRTRRCQRPSAAFLSKRKAITAVTK